MQVSTRGIGVARARTISACPEGIFTGGKQDIHGVEQAREVVREQIRYGADWIKVFPTADIRSALTANCSSSRRLRCAEVQAIVDEAHRHHRKVAAHAYGGEGLKNSVMAGVDCIEHGQGLDDSEVAMMIQKASIVT